MKKRILVTGGAGFVGSNVVQKLLSVGHTVIVLDNFSSHTSKQNRHQIVSTHETITGDILDKTVLRQCFSNKIDVVIHLAAKTGVRSSVSKPGAYFKTNLLGTLSILEAMKKHDVHQLIVASSSSVYGNSTKIPFRESDPIDTPISPYAASKISAEAICGTYAYLYKINATILRFFTAYGPGNRRDMAAYLFLDAIMKGKKISIFGDGESKRDFTYVGDISEGVLRAVNTPFPLEVINLGNSRSVTVNELIKGLENVTGKKARVKYLPGVKTDMAITQACIDKATKLLHWQPVVDLETGLTQLYHWYLSK